MYYFSKQNCFQLIAWLAGSQMILYNAGKRFFTWQTDTAQKMKFSMKDFLGKCDQIHRKLDLVTFTEEILNGKLHFLCSDNRKTLGKLIFISQSIAFQFCKVRRNWEIRADFENNVTNHLLGLAKNLAKIARKLHLRCFIRS